VVRDPVGVVGAITPWNYPLNQIALKVAPALAAGCTVVLKPSEIAPFNAFILAEVIDAAGLPKGVFNLVTGFGPSAGEALVKHPQVDMISFTGSTRAGKRISELASQTVKRVALELGGKSASVILEDADLAAAVKGHGERLLPQLRADVHRAHAHAGARIKYDEAAKLAWKPPRDSRWAIRCRSERASGPLPRRCSSSRVRDYIKKGVARAPNC
jgi:betaine-aldehyde dehydrogenase